MAWRALTFAVPLQEARVVASAVLATAAQGYATQGRHSLLDLVAFWRERGGHDGVVEG